MYKICVSGVLQLTCTCKKEPIAKYFPRRVAKLFFFCYCFSGEISDQLTHLAVHCLEAVKE